MVKIVPQSDPSDGASVHKLPNKNQKSPLMKRRVKTTHQHFHLPGPLSLRERAPITGAPITRATKL